MTPLNAVYVSHNPVGDPLVRSQVLAYLAGLAERGIVVDLVTFERGPGTGPPDGFPRERWHPLRAMPGGTVAAKLIDLARGTALVAGLVVRRRARLIHARSYVPAAIAMAVGLLTGTPFVFDMRGFLDEEYIDGGHWREGELRVRLFRRAERWLLRRAAAVVVLTDAAARRMRSEPRYSRAVDGGAVVVVPCMVDLDRFRPAPSRADRPTFVFSGAVGLRNRIDAVLEVFATARSIAPDVRLLILNRGQHDEIRAAMEKAGLGASDVEVRAIDFGDMPSYLARSHVGIALQRFGRSKEGVSAVKVAEYLGCGLPVIVNAGHGDISEAVAAYRCGHVVDSYSTDDLRAAASAAVSLAADEGARRRARELAETTYDLRAGVDRYEALYRAVAISGDRSALRDRLPADLSSAPGRDRR